MEDNNKSSNDDNQVPKTAEDLLKEYHGTILPILNKLHKRYDELSEEKAGEKVAIISAIWECSDYLNKFDRDRLYEIVNPLFKQSWEIWSYGKTNDGENWKYFEDNILSTIINIPLMRCFFIGLDYASGNTKEHELDQLLRVNLQTLLDYFPNLVNYNLINSNLTDLEKGELINFLISESKQIGIDLVNLAINTYENV
jgi:hypothetical protein